MAYKTLRNNIKSLLDEITTIQEVSDHPKFDWGGYPAAFIAPSGNESDFLTNIENVRVYAFKIWLFQEYDQTTLSDAYNILLDETENILNKFDEQESPDSGRELANDLANKYLLTKVFATPGQFALD